jgi:hypothetical protein
MVTASGRVVKRMWGNPEGLHCLPRNVVFDKEAGRVYNEHMHKIIRVDANLLYMKAFPSLGGLRHDVRLRRGFLSILNRHERSRILYKSLRTRGCDVPEA